MPVTLSKDRWMSSSFSRFPAVAEYANRIRRHRQQSWKVNIGRADIKWSDEKGEGFIRWKMRWFKRMFNANPTPHPPKKKSKFDKSAMSSERHRNDFLAQSFSWIVSILYQSIQTCIRLYQAISKWDGPVCFFYQSRTRSRVKKSTRHAENPQKFGKPIRTTRCGMKTHTPLLDPFQMKDKKNKYKNGIVQTKNSTCDLKTQSRQRIWGGGNNTKHWLDPIAIA